MKLLLINGSPRGKGSNSRILAEKFLEGFGSNHEYEIVDLRKEIDSLSNLANKVLDYTHTIILFPLYTDAMPAIVKKFIEEMGKSEITFKDKNLGFVVQSGFPESYQSEFIARYLSKFTKRIGANYLGAIIKGGVEGIKIQPAWMTKKLFNNFNKLGRIFSETGNFDEEIRSKLATPRVMSKGQIRIYKLISKTGLTNFYWNSQLKKNKVFDKRFARPYEIKS